MRAIRQLVLGVMTVALAATLAAPAYAIGCEGIALPDGCLFTITGNDTPDPNDGFAVTNAYDVPMWDFVKDRDLDAVGYPISQRWVDGPFTLQAFQKVILQWSPGENRMNWYNTLDVLAAKYPDVELPNVPRHQVLAANQGVTDFAVMTRNHLAILEANSAIKAAYLAKPNWLDLYGLPIRYEEREVNGHPQGLQLLRAQRTVFEIWNVSAPGTSVGSVSLQNVPDKVKELTNVIIPDQAKEPQTEVSPEVLATKVTTMIYSLPWVSTEITPLEQDVIDRLESIAKASPDIFWYLIRDMKLPSTSSIIERPIYSKPTTFTLTAIELLTEITNLTWMQDGVDKFELLAFRILCDSTFIWPAYIEVLLKELWLRDGLSQDELRFLDRTYNTLYSLTLFPGNPQRLGEIIAQLMAMPYMDTIEGFEPHVFSALTLIYGDDLQALQGIISYLASKGGLTDEHALILRIHGGDQEYIDSITDINNPKQFDQYLVEPSSRGITLEKRQIFLPRAGPTLLMIVRDGFASTRTMDILEDSVRLIEDTMGEAYPTKTVVLVREGMYTSSNLPIVRFRSIDFRSEHVDDYTKSTLIHELAHHYWHRGTAWIYEGASTFIEVRTGYISAEGLNTKLARCSVNRIADISDEQDLLEGCPYSLGASLFLDLYNNLGDDRFHKAFRKLYRIITSFVSDYQLITRGNIWINRPESDDYCGYCGGVDPALYHVRLAFVNESDPVVAAIADPIISRWFYGAGP